MDFHEMGMRLNAVHNMTFHEMGIRRIAVHNMKAHEMKILYFYEYLSNFFPCWRLHNMEFHEMWCHNMDFHEMEIRVNAVHNMKVHEMEILRFYEYLGDVSVALCFSVWGPPFMHEVAMRENSAVSLIR